MNDYGMGPSPDGYGALSRPMPPRRGIDPSGRVVADSYQNDIMHGFEKQAPTYNSSNPERPQSSALVDLKDPIQVHLLTETALGDSKEFEILSQEELDGLKKQCQALTQRIENTRSNLLIQAKYRDAAVSMAKLYSPTIGESKKRSWLDGNRMSGDDMREAAAEREACERKCEELASELFGLEKELMEPRRRILEHTAGVLQLTHKASRRRLAHQNGQPLNGIPGSPESMYTYSHGRNSLDAPGDEVYMDDSFPGLDALDTARARKNPLPLEIPLKSPIREQQSQLREEMDRLKEENNTLLSSVAEMERKLEGLNGSLRETIVRFNPAGNTGYEPPPSTSAFSGSKPGEALRSQVDYLESGLVAVQAEQESYKPSVGGDAQLGERIESMNLQLRDLLMTADTHYEPVSMPDEADVEGQLRLLEDSLGHVDTNMSRLLQSGAGSSSVEAAMIEMWDVIQNGYTSIRQTREDRRRARAEKGLEDDESMSDDEGVDLTETYSPLNLSSRVRWLYRQATMLRDQKSVLKRQIKQQRELNNKSDAEKDAELAQKQEMLDEKELAIEQAESEAMNAQRMLSQALEDLEQAKGKTGNNEELEAELRERTERTEALETKLRDMQNHLATAESDSENTQKRLAQIDSTITALNAQLDEAERSRAEAEQSRAEVEERAGSLEQEIQQKQEALEEVQTALKNKEKDMDDLNASYVELKTEVTIARAELDGAYGSRAERAADAAALHNADQVEKLQAQVIRLKEELSGTVKDLEDITKEGISAEREKVDLEGKLDDALHVRTSLEAEVSSLRERLEVEAERSQEKMARLQEELDGERLKASRGDGARPGIGASLLSEQFRATMREERKKYQEDIREERSRTRKFEEELVKLKRAQGPGKSPLSPR